MYVCETCGYESKSRDDVEKHEASHLGLTVSELHEYNTLKSFASYMGSVVLSSNNNETQQKFDKAIDDLVAFESKHGITHNMLEY